MKNLLTANYKTLTPEERANAIAAARAAGGDFARNDPKPYICDCSQPMMPHTCPASAKLRPMRAHVDDYIASVFEPVARTHNETTDCDIELFICTPFDDDDPRVRAFIEAANAEYEARTKMRA